ncbi:MAG TPA: heme-copper oxidase subunit III [Candidatus Acidoferrales bacterium]|nr:heme-copper oxidase subunit III [Candidatus Acidoferrales bacterium]
MMPGSTVADEIELIGTGKGGGGSSSGNDGNAGGGGDDWKNSFGSARVPQRAYVTGMTIALGGVLMFFMALVSAYIVRKDMPNSAWVPFNIPRILWLNTAILIASSFTLARSRSRFLADDDAGFRHWWGVTTVLGIFFLIGQVIAWRQLAAAGVFLATNPASSFFYVFTAAHGLHLLGGVLALLYVAFRPTHRLTKGTATEVVSMYWHFMDGLWVFLFLLLLLGR